MNQTTSEKKKFVWLTLPKAETARLGGPTGLTSYESNRVWDIGESRYKTDHFSRQEANGSLGPQHRAPGDLRTSD